MHTFFLFILRYNLTSSQIYCLQELGYRWTSIASILNISVRTLFNHRAQLGLLANESFSNISDEELDSLIQQVLSATPNVGETYVSGSIRSRGLRVQRRRIRERLCVIDPVGRAIRRRQAIRRRIYNIRIPNQLW